MHLPHLLLSIQYSEVIVCTHICWDLTVTSFPSYINSFFSHISERILKIHGNQRYLSMYVYIALGKVQILGKFISLGLFLLQDTAGSTAFNVDYARYSPYLD